MRRQGKLDLAVALERIMGQEIERKFLVTGEDWRGLDRGTPFRQGYLVAAEARSVLSQAPPAVSVASRSRR